MSKKIILKGTTEQLKPVITQILAIHQMLEGLDLGAGSDRDSEAYPERRYRPQIRLHFLQDTDFDKRSNAPGYHGERRVPGRLTWRLMNETSETITLGELTRIGQQIKQIFGANSGYVWQKGKEIYTYADWDKGYQMQILARSASQAQDLVSKILSLQGHTPTWKYMTKGENLDQPSRYPETPVTKLILGKSVTMPKTRPNVEVRFAYADARIHKLLEPVVIYDRTNKKVGALVR
ncbi:hypothetical protein [Scytonema millei]|uniref:Uncharacterized protein n=1 Tax=Scytonema millei VB511283 TaxID=1245923 RepID=A0A9X5I487_9CYAN|nr:hypothetical protein [Scytonema millei]NHC34695.1 hypothetical protein [Scytonema millei VB511283]